MKAVYCETYGPPEELIVKDVPSPEPGPGEVKILLRARGVSYTDVLKIAGQYQVKDDPPFIPGGEASGEVLALGPSVDGFAVGDRVLSGGGFAEETVQSVTDVIKLPAHIDFRKAAAFRSNYTTALYGLQRGRLKAGETLLVHGAAGGVGLAAVDVGKLLGARVIATASTNEKLKVCEELGADHTIDYTDGFRDAIKDLTDGKGADVIYDPVGGEVFDESMRCIAPFGRILIVGFTGGRPSVAKTNHLLIKDAEVIGFTIGALSRNDTQWAEHNLKVLVGWLASGRINPYYSHTRTLDEVPEALKLIAERKVMGKALIV